jgi:hypothetical protein
MTMKFQLINSLQRYLNRVNTNAQKIGLEKIYRDDIFLVSYPKSGNTWIRFLLANLLAAKNPVTYESLEDYIPSLHRSKERINQFRRPRIIKSHFPFYYIYPKSIYIVRDGRDALVSFYHYLSDLGKFKGSFEDFFFSDAHMEVGTWQTHVQGALSYKKENPSNMVIIRYEDLLVDTVLQIRRIVSFCDINKSEEAILEAVEKSTFKQLKRMQREKGIFIENKKVNFFRRGVTRQWQAYFSPEISELFIRESGELLGHLGYDL